MAPATSQAPNSVLWPCFPLRIVCLFSYGKKIIFLSYYPINIVNIKILSFGSFFSRATQCPIVIFTKSKPSNFKIMHIYTHTILFLLEALDKKNTTVFNVNGYGMTIQQSRVFIVSGLDLLWWKHGILPDTLVSIFPVLLILFRPSLFKQRRPVSAEFERNTWRERYINFFLFVCGAHLHFPTENRTKQDASLLSNFYRHLQKSTMCPIQNVLKTVFETSLMSSECRLMKHNLPLPTVPHFCCALVTRQHSTTLDTC